MGKVEFLYQVHYRGICAGFVMQNGQVINCAPVLKKWDLKRAIKTGIARKVAEYTVD